MGRRRVRRSEDLLRFFGGGRVILLRTGKGSICATWEAACEEGKRGLLKSKDNVIEDVL
jgi:hypothetical protein